MNFLSLSSLSDYWGLYQVNTNIVVFLNVVGALFLGLFVGYERSYRGRAAGMRTYGLVCMGACAVIVIAGYPASWYGGHGKVSEVDLSRIIQGVISGIGFLGGGVIVRDGLNISGLTTAASIWVVSVIGILVGVGFYGAAMCVTLLAAALMMWGAKIEGLLPSRHAVAITLYFKKDSAPSEQHLQHIIIERGYEIAKGSFSISERNGQPEWRFVAVSLGHGKGGSLVSLSRGLGSSEDIESFSVSHARN
jgi:putative Mg2+ transporter-C (MgtC) family protein